MCCEWMPLNVDRERDIAASYLAYSGMIQWGEGG